MDGVLGKHVADLCSIPNIDVVRPLSTTRKDLWVFQSVPLKNDKKKIKETLTGGMMIVFFKQYIPNYTTQLAELRSEPSNFLNSTFISQEVNLYLCIIIVGKKRLLECPFNYFKHTTTQC